MKPRRIALYARVSTKDKGQDTENQLFQLREFSAKQDWTIVREYIDHVSGKTSEKRPQFQAMLAAASRREFDLVLKPAPRFSYRQYQTLEKSALRGEMCAAAVGAFQRRNQPRLIAIVSYMANRKQFARLKNGVEVWNAWRKENPDEGIDLREANLREADLREVNLRRADLHGADLSGADLRRAKLRGADLRGANLHGANLHGADLIGADLHGADLGEADFRGALYATSTKWPKDFDRIDLGAVLYDEIPDAPPEEDFTITFSEELSAEQIRTALEALADYYQPRGSMSREKTSAEARKAVAEAALAEFKAADAEFELMTKLSAAGMMLNRDNRGNLTVYKNLAPPP
jgi:hypothetical protein